MVKPFRNILNQTHQLMEEDICVPHNKQNTVVFSWKHIRQNHVFS